MRYVIVDLEATCWEHARDARRMETIEIGAVELLSSRGPTARSFGRFVRPVSEPTLSDFCTRLTTIRQSDVDRAERFPQVFWAFVEWIGPGPFVWGSWGAYDLGQLQTDCRRHGMIFPPEMERHINLKTEFARVLGVKSCGMMKALQQVGLKPVGTHHRGLDDAANIAPLAMRILPIVEEVEAIDPHAAGSAEAE